MKLILIQINNLKLQWIYFIKKVEREGYPKMPCNWSYKNKFDYWDTWGPCQVWNYDGVVQVVYHESQIPATTGGFELQPLTNYAVTRPTSYFNPLGVR